MPTIETLAPSLTPRSLPGSSDDPIVRAIEALDFLHNLVVTDRPDLPLSPDTCWRTDTTAAREGLERLLSVRSDL